MDDDAVGEGLVVRLNVQCPLSAVQCVLLDEVNIVHTCDLDTPTVLIRYRCDQANKVCVRIIYTTALRRSLRRRRFVSNDVLIACALIPIVMLRSQGLVRCTLH